MSLHSSHLIAPRELQRTDSDLHDRAHANDCFPIHAWRNVDWHNVAASRRGRIEGPVTV